MTVATLECPEAQAAGRRANPQGMDRLAMLAGKAIADWAQRRADRKAMRRSRSPLSALSAHEQARLFHEANQLREQAYAERSRWHVTG